MLYYRVKLLDTGFGIMESGSDLMPLEKEMGKTRFSVSYVSKASLASLTTFVFMIYAFSLSENAF